MPAPRPAADREAARRLIFDQGTTIAEAARTIGATPGTVARWFPDAPKMTRHERSAWANYCKHTVSKIGL
jgi:transposase-like protein